MKGVRLNEELRDQFEQAMAVCCDLREEWDLPTIAVAIPPEWYGGFKAAVGWHQARLFSYGKDEEMCMEVSLPKEYPSMEDGYMILMGDDLYIHRNHSKFLLVPDGGAKGFDPITQTELDTLREK